MFELGKTIVFIGLGLVFLGLIVLILGKFNLLGRLPGDVIFKKGNFTLYFPLASCVVFSLIMSFIMFFLSRK